MNNPSAQGPDIKNVIFALLAATAIMLGWQHFYERPRMIAMKAQQAQEQAKKAEEAPKAPAPLVAKSDSVPAAEAPANTGPRIRIDTPSLHGSISTTGGRFDDLSLVQYHEEISSDSPEVKLLDHAGQPNAYFAELGMLAADSTQKMPDATTRWSTNDTVLTTDKPVTLTWNNGGGLKFTRTIAVDDKFMFTITTSVTNASATPVTLYPYGLISRNYADTSKHYIIMHEGPLGAVNGALEDVTYKKLREEGPENSATPAAGSA